MSYTPPHAHIATGDRFDFNFTNDPFSDDQSIPASPASQTSTTSLSLDPTDLMTPLKLAVMKCCRCPTTLPLLSEYDPRTQQHKAVCTSCTHALCKNCVVEGADVVAFTGKKAAVPLEAKNVGYWHFCMSCGRAQEIDMAKVKRMNGVAIVDVKGIMCFPCNQKANSSNMLVASITKATREHGMPLFKEMKKMPAVQEDVKAEPETTKSRQIAQEEILKGDVTRMSSSGNVEGRRRHWSIRTVKRWASISSLRSM